MNSIFRLRKINKNNKNLASSYLGFSVNKMEVDHRMNFRKFFTKIIKLEIKD